ncbi:hypothetical protein IFM89_029779 [Coptis chinensis]|uniref:Uncharacterized protein n=1 Tax=Coptis chinensis TaxID=261450 RepID=A0A835IHE2_9MAGN|nr:hypothetical protein IFM89_029779 [Coptis chinensis]
MLPVFSNKLCIHPTVPATLGLVFIVGQIFYFIGYSIGDPNNRMKAGDTLHSESTISISHGDLQSGFTRSRKEIAEIFFGLMTSSMNPKSAVSPAFNLATNDTGHTMDEGIPHLVVYSALIYFSASYSITLITLNLRFLYHPILNLPRSSLRAYLAGLLSGFGNCLHFMAGQAAGYAAFLEGFGHIKILRFFMLGEKHLPIHLLVPHAIISPSLCYARCIMEFKVTLKRLRNVVSTSTRHSSMDDQPQRISSVARFPSAVTTVFKAAAKAI